VANVQFSQNFEGYDSKKKAIRNTNLKKKNAQFLVPLPGVGGGDVEDRRRRSACGAMDPNNFPAVWAAVGPGVSGAVFGAAWLFWVDAVVCSAAAVPFLHYLPGKTLPLSFSTISIP
jgi:hypothetical protein